jgi:two-component system sensor histidine kinase and response regulator WspE
VKETGAEDLSHLSMLELFRVETETQTAVLTRGLLELERLQDGGKPRASTAASALPPETVNCLEVLMRAAHCLKGAARIMNLTPGVQIAHAMEDCFVAAQRGRMVLNQEAADLLLRGVDLLVSLSRFGGDLRGWENENAPAVKRLLAALAFPRSDTAAPAASTSSAGPSLENGSAPGMEKEETATVPETIASLAESVAPAEQPGKDAVLPRADQRTEATDRVLRLTAANLNRLLGLAGESLVESRWLRPFSDSMQRLNRMQAELERTLESLRQSVQPETLPESTRGRINELFRQTSEARQFLAERLQELDLYDRRSAHLSNRLYLEVLRARMRPFADGVGRFPRLVRDLARSLGKQVKLEIVGENTQVDRDILERLDAPLNHLLRNAVDHGCEPPEAREHAGKPPEATIRLEARHSAGMLLVMVSDDGAGVDSSRVRQLIADRKLATPAIAEKMSEPELLQFLFQPGFSLRETVTEISGRGVGLDVVLNMARSVRGSVRVHSQPGRGTRFQLQLPLTLSVLRTLLVEVGGEPYAIPLAQIVSTVKLLPESVDNLEGRPHFKLGQQQISLLPADRVLECPESKPPAADSRADTGLPVVVLGDRNQMAPWEKGPVLSGGPPHSSSTRNTSEGFRGYGLLVDRFLGERELVVQPLDDRLGKVKGISAAALMEDGSPVLIVDVDDLVTSIEQMLTSGSLGAWNWESPPGAQTASGELKGPATFAPKRKRVLAVDDSLTVRELERKLLLNSGYLADVAVDGLDGWNAVSSGAYDLVITDVDMPRMDGIELASLIKRDPQLKSLPVMIVSYKDREADRLRGLEAGADYYLTKGSFHDEALLQAVRDLIGDPE